MNIPSLLTLETATAGNRQIKISDALVNYHHLKGIDRDVLFFTTSKRFVGYVIDILDDRHIFASLGVAFRATRAASHGDYEQAKKIVLEQ